MVIKTCPVDANGYFNLSAANLWHGAVASRAKIVIVETDPALPYVQGIENGLHESQVDYVIEGDGQPVPELPSRRRPMPTVPSPGCPGRAGAAAAGPDGSRRGRTLSRRSLPAGRWCRSRPASSAAGPGYPAMPSRWRIFPSQARLRSVSGTSREFRPSKATVRSPANRTPGVRGWASGPATTPDSASSGAGPAAAAGPAAPSPTGAAGPGPPACPTPAYSPAGGTSRARARNTPRPATAVPAAGAAPSWSAPGHHQPARTADAGLNPQMARGEDAPRRQ